MWKKGKEKEETKNGVWKKKTYCNYIFYSELWLDDDYKQRSSEVKNNNNPVWNETFIFNVAKGSSDKKLYLKVYDKDLIGSDKIGDTKVDIKDIISSGRPFNQW